jgi:hypothetical protein
MYAVTSKFVPPAGQTAPGEHYTVKDPELGESVFRQVHFYRTPRGRETAEDAIGVRLQDDGDVFRLVRAAVETYDAEREG